LTNARPSSGSSLALRSYWLCGQYPSAVAARETVTLYCASNLPPARYVIVQYRFATAYMAFCELEVFALGQKLSNISHYSICCVHYFNTGYTCILLLARLMGQHCFARWRLSSSSVVVVCNAAGWRAGGCRARGRSAAAGSGAWAVWRPTMHGGPVRLRPSLKRHFVLFTFSALTLLIV